MSAPTQAAPAAAQPKKTFLEALKPFAVPYYLAVAAVLGGVTVAFLALIGVIVLVVTNFNLLSLIE
jgi:hypothetical protein